MCCTGIMAWRSRKHVYKAMNQTLQVLPLFFGPSSALTDFVPKCIEKVQARQPGLSIRIAEVYVGACRPWLLLAVCRAHACFLQCLVDTSGQSDTRIADILADLVCAIKA